MSDSRSAMAIPAPPVRKTTSGVDVEKIVSSILFSITAILIVAPVGYVIYGSLRTDSPLAPDSTFTWANLAYVYGSEQYRSALYNTIALSFVVAALSILIGGALAWIVARTDAPGRRQLALMTILPLMTSNLITALAWITIAAPNAGFLNAMVRSVFDIRVLFDIYSFSGIVLVMVLHYAAFAFVAMFATLRTIDASLEEASYIAGAGPFSTALRMTLPLIWPTITATFLMTFILASENFSVPTLLGSPIGLQTLPSRIFFEMTVEPSQPSISAAGGTMLLWIAIVGTYAQRRIIARTGRYVTIGGKGARARLVRLGSWKYVATAVLVIYVLLAVVAPYVTLIFSSFLGFLTPRLALRLFTLDNYRKLADFDNLQAAINSIVLSLVGGAVLTLLYVLLGYLIKRSERGVGKLIDYLVLIPTALPALVLAVGVLWCFVAFPAPIYGTMAILTITYFIRFIGYGIRQSRVALTQISEDLPEAARICGASPLGAFRDVVAPLLRNAFLSLWTILFIFIFTEISATILLYSPDTITLPVVLWNEMASGHQTSALAVAVVQATVIFALLLAADRLFGTLRNTIDTRH